ncbi:MAG: crossover junction endodeoxyribonuclease RuvC [Ectothiorhodospiraceae bacterium]|nr:crossover junction endodeoxyribonuclease RuvC [Ectothiorhodospiraceae bacterium]
MQRILGIDPGSNVTGYGLIESDGRSSHCVASGCIRVKGDGLPERLGYIFEAVSALVADHAPEQMAIEAVFVSRNAASALKLGQARGAAILAGVQAGLPVCEYSPREVKQAVVGTGAATKDQVGHMVRMLLKLTDGLAADASDALAIALCHAHSQHTRALVGAAYGRRRR